MYVRVCVRLSVTLDRTTGSRCSTGYDTRVLIVVGVVLDLLLTAGGSHFSNNFGTFLQYNVRAKLSLKWDPPGRANR